MPIEQRTLWTDAALTDPFLIPGIWSSTKPANLCLHQSTAWFPQIDVALYRAPVQTERANPVTHFLEVEYKGLRCRCTSFTSRRPRQFTISPHIVSTLSP